MLDPKDLQQHALAINELAQQAHAIAVAHGFWNDSSRNIGEAIALIHSELSEALEAARHGNPRSDVINHPQVAEELADAIIRIIDLAAGLGYNIGNAVVDKMAYNATRPYKHGKAF